METKYLKRVMRQVKLSQQDWDQLIEDFQNGEEKNTIMAKYGLRNLQYKTLKKYFIGK